MSFEPEVLHPAVQQALVNLHVSCETLRCDPALADTAAFCEHYGFSPDQAANAIIVIGKSDPPKHACCLVLATCRLDVNKKVSALLGVKRCSFASAELTMELTSMEIGGVTPIGLPAAMPVYVDAEILRKDKVVIGGGNRSSKIIVCPGEFQKIPNLEVIEALAMVR